jgi:thiosulfate reductase cytochrome b subunit
MSDEPADDEPVDDPADAPVSEKGAGDPAGGTQAKETIDASDGAAVQGESAGDTGAPPLILTDTAGEPAGAPPVAAIPEEPISVVDEHLGQRLVIVKHHALVRLSHWLNVPILFAMIVSGLSIYWASPVFLHKPDPVTHSRDYLADLGIAIARHVPGAKVDRSWFYDHFGIGVFNLAGALRWHWLFVYASLVNGILYLLGLALGGGYRALLPRRTMVSESIAMIRYYAGVVPMKVLRRPWRHPEITTKYNALQRGAYASMPVAGALALASGWAMHKPAQLGWLERMFGSYDGARIVHFVVMIYFVLFLIPHLVLVAVDGWDTMRSMIVGWSQRTGGVE